MRLSTFEEEEKKRKGGEAEKQQFVPEDGSEVSQNQPGSVSFVLYHGTSLVTPLLILWRVKVSSKLATLAVMSSHWTLPTVCTRCEFPSFYWIFAGNSVFHAGITFRTTCNSFFYLSADWKLKLRCDIVILIIVWFHVCFQSSVLLF